MSMNVEHINPFIESVHELFETMLGINVSRGNIGVSTGSNNPREIMALIGLSGPARGAVSISFPASTALRLVEQLLGVETRVIDDTVSDGVAEVVNIIAGSAKAKFVTDGGTPIELSLPTVFRGSDFRVDYPTQSVWLEVPFNTDLGPFSMRVTFDFEESKTKEGDSA